MAVSSFAGGSGGSRRRKSRTKVSRTNAPKAYSNPYAQAASQQKVSAPDPLTNALSQQQQMMMAQGGGAAAALSPQEQMAASQGAGGSMNPQQAMANAQGGSAVSSPVNQQQVMAMAQGAGSSQPANMPPPPPPPPPAPPAPQPTMAQMQGTGAPPAPQPTMAEMQAPNPVSPLDGSVRPSGGPPALSFTTTNVATGPDTGVGQTEFVPQDPGAAMAAMQGGGNVARQPTMAEMQGGGSVIPQPTMAQMQGTGNTALLQPATQPSMAEMQGGGAVTPALSPQEQMALLQGGGAVSPQPSMADAQGTVTAPTLSPQEQMAMAQNAANTAMNDRLAAALGGSSIRGGMFGERLGVDRSRNKKGGKKPKPSDTSSSYTNPYEQAALLQRGGSTESYGEEMAARQGGGGGGGGMTPQEEMAARQGAGLPDVSGYRSPYEQAALAQGGDVTATPTPTGATDAQAEMFAQQGGGLQTFASTGGTEEQLAMEEVQQRSLSGDPALESQLRAQLEMAARQGDGGLRTFAASPEFNPNAAGLENLARRQDAGLETFAARGSRYNRGAEQLRRQAGQRLSGTLQDRLEQAYMGRIDAADDPILASQIADQQLRQQEAQQGLVEQLSRYGVLRGGGDTAAALTRLSEGNERNRLALEAAAAQRRQGDLRDASAFDQARSSMDIAQRGQSLEERIGADRLLDTALARDVTRAGQTGQFRDATSTTGFRDTLAAQEQRQRMDLAEREQDLRERTGAQDIATSALGRDVTRAGLTGQFERQETLDAQERRQRMKLDMADATGLIFDDKGGQRETLDRERQRRELNIAESDQARRDRLADQDVATSALGRDVTRAGLTGQFERQDTLQAQLQRQQMNLAEDANRRADVAQRAGLLGEVDGEGSAPARTTLAGRELELREDIARAEDRRAQQAAESALFGQVVTGAENQAPIKTLEGQQAQSALDSAALAREATEAGLTGRFEGGMTADERDRDLARRISEAGVTGRFDTERRGIGTVDTIQSQAIESSLQNEALNRGLSRAGATGLFREEGDTGPGTETLESRLRTAGLTGELDNQLTLGGRQAEQDLIGSILAASDPELEGRTDALAEALTGRLGIEERGRVEERFQDAVDELGDDASLDDFLRLADEYADYPSITDALEEMMAEQTRKKEEKEKEEERKENIGLRGRRNRTQENRGK
jgi:hypothetical protein